MLMLKALIYIFHIYCYCILNCCEFSLKSVKLNNFLLFLFFFGKILFNAELINYFYFYIEWHAIWLQSMKKHHVRKDLLFLNADFDLNFSFSFLCFYENFSWIWTRGKFVSIIIGVASTIIFKRQFNPNFH